MQKPSPVLSVILFVCGAILLYCAFGTRWYSMGGEGGLGLMRGSFGDESKFYITDRHIELESILGTMAGLLAFGAAIVSVIAGVMLLKPGKSMLALFAVITMGAAMVFALAFTGKVGHIGSFGAGFYLFWLCSIGVLVAGIMGMTRARSQLGAIGYPAGMPMQPMPMQMQMPVAMCPTCQGPTMFVAQYNRSFCQRCNRYI